MAKTAADKVWERKLKLRPDWMIGFIRLYKFEVVNYVEAEADEENWHSLSLGWGLAKGMDLNEAQEFAEFVSGFEDRL